MPDPVVISHFVVRSTRNIPAIAPTVFPPATIDVDAVFEGGGTLGAAYVGSLNLMARAGVRYRRIAGNSAGAITAALTAAGYSPDELEWAMSNFNFTRTTRPAMFPANFERVDFMDFLDLPTISSVSTAVKRNTLLWKSLKGQVIDEFLKTSVPVPTRTDAVNAIITGLKANGFTQAVFLVRGAEAAIRGLLNGALALLPTRAPSLNDFNPFKTEGLRIQFADKMWDLAATSNPLILLEAQLMHEGSVFEGNALISTIDRLLRAKIPGTGPVVFRDLPVPLAVISCNYATSQIAVYSSRNTPNMSVAEAVRRSMSLPLIFQPRKVNPNNRGLASTETMIDGGVASNFPIWLFTDSGNQYWPATSIDSNRIKIGLSLDEKKGTPSSWNSRPPKFIVDSSGGVTVTDIAAAALIGKLKATGLFIPQPSFPESQLVNDLKNLKVLEVLLGWLSVDKELAIRDQIIANMMNGKPYFDITIPLQGFSGADFSINSDRADMDSIAGRGFMAALDALKNAPATGTGSAIITNPGGFINPY